MPPAPGSGSPDGSTPYARSRIQDDVQVVGHDGKGVYAPRTAKRGSTEVFSKPIPVDIIANDVLTTVAAGHDVVDSIRVLEA